MAESPIKQTMIGFLDKLKEAIQARSEADKRIVEYRAALLALAKVMEDKEAADGCLAMLEEMSGKPGFLNVIRSVLRLKTADEEFTPGQIRNFIVLGKKMDLSIYSNPMASIHTTLRRMKESGEVEEVINDKGEKAYRLIKKGGIEPPPVAPSTLSELRREAAKRKP